jgi:serine protease
MQVGQKVAGEAGYLYAILLDNWTLGNVKQWDGLASGSDYLVGLDANPPGTYFLLVSSDNDNDFKLCDEGEFCQIYPLASQASEIIVVDRHMQLGSFTMGFPIDDDGGNVSAAAFEPESQSSDAGILEIKSRIGISGVSRKR